MTRQLSLQQRNPEFGERKKFSSDQRLIRDKLTHMTFRHKRKIWFFGTSLCTFEETLLLKEKRRRHRSPQKWHVFFLACKRKYSLGNTLAAGVSGQTSERRVQPAVAQNETRLAELSPCSTHTQTWNTHEKKLRTRLTTRIRNKIIPVN